MAWRIEFLPQAEKELARLDHQVVGRIFRFLDTRLRNIRDPRAIGEALRGEKLGKYWKYRVGDYRLICSIRDDRIVITVITVGHRSDIYR
jgi:mRNA interferase RelE/StbE